MPLTIRIALVVGGIVALGIAAAFLLGFTPVTKLWPYPGYGLSKVFVASIFAAIGAPVIWIGVANEPAAIPGGAANLLISGGGIGVHGLMRGTAGAQWLAGASILTAVAAAGIMIYGARRQFADRRPTPPTVRWSFAAFVVLLIGVGGALVGRVPNIFPWTLDGDSSVVYGFAFLGAAAYFGYGVARPVLGNASGQLLAFLAYDLVLIGPYTAHWGAVSPTMRLSLGLYIAVLVYSGGLAIFYLLINPATRLGRSSALT